MDGLSVIVRHALGQYRGSKGELARKAGVPWSTFSAVARGTRRVTPAVAAKIAKGLVAVGEVHQRMSAACAVAARLIETQVARIQKGDNP